MYRIIVSHRLQDRDSRWTDSHRHRDSSDVLMPRWRQTLSIIQLMLDRNALLYSHGWVCRRVWSCSWFWSHNLRLLRRETPQNRSLDDWSSHDLSVDEHWLKQRQMKNGTYNQCTYPLDLLGQTVPKEWIHWHARRDHQHRWLRLDFVRRQVPLTWEKYLPSNYKYLKANERSSSLLNEYGYKYEHVVVFLLHYIEYEGIHCSLIGERLEQPIRRWSTW